MSAIFGLLYFDGRMVEPAQLDVMGNAMRYWGPDGSHTWRAGSVGMGHLLKHNTPESRYERQPCQNQNRTLTLAAGARIDNREELLRTLDITVSDRSKLPDSVIILKAYERWGDACVNHLLGDWAFAIWDAQRHTLFLARDHHGNTGLFYYRSDQFFAFASSLKGLAALPEVPHRPDPWRIAKRLVAWPEGEKTFYTDILRLPPAHCLTVTPGKHEIRRYWDLEHAPEVRYRTDDDYETAFLEIFTEAVRCRLRSHRPIGVTLSGGLDSGSVAALAGRELSKIGQQLHAFTSVPIHAVDGLVAANHFGDESHFAEATAHYTGNVDLHLIRAEHISPLAGLKRHLALCDEPGYAVSNIYWLIALMEQAQQHGLGTLLIAQSGNGTVSWVGDKNAVIRDLIRGGRWRGYWQEFNGCRAETNFKHALRSCLVRPLVPHGLIRRYRQLRTRGESWREYSPINPTFADTLALRQWMAQSGHDPTFIEYANSRAARISNLGYGRALTGSTWQQIGAGFGLEVRDPTADKRVVEFCLGLPEDQYYRQGKNRYLIRRAMDGLLPPEVLWNRRRGLQAADIGQRVVESRVEIQTALKQMAQLELAQEYLDLPRMNDILRVALDELNAAVTTQVGTILLRGLMMGLFLDRFDP